MTTSRRIITATALLTLLTGVTHANAAVKKKAPPKPKPVCNIVTDSTPNDATGVGLPAQGPNDPSLDIKSADVATNASTLTVWFRLADLDMTWTGSNDSSPYGRAYALEFDVKGVHQKLVGRISPVGNVWPDTTGVVDTTKKEIHYSVALSKLTAKFKPGDKLTGLKVSSWRYFLTVDGTSGRADEALGSLPYVVAYPSCVKVGS